MTLLRRALPATLLLSVGLAACGEAPSPASTDRVAYTGAVVWDGTGAPPVENATLVVADGRVVSLEAGGAVPPGATEVDLSDRYVIPGLIDAHAHVTGYWADDTVTAERARVEGDLLLFARYGVTTVNSLGGAPEAAGAVRADQDAPAPGRARLRFAGEVVTGPTPEEARAQVAANAERGADWIKMRVDDNLGTTEKMAWPTVEAAMAEAHDRGLPVATHLFYLDDARRLLELGTDMVAHSVRDTAAPAELARRLRDQGVCYVPTLTREITTFAYAERPEWFDDPFFQRWAKASEVEAVTDPDFQARMAESPAAADYREALAVAKDNLKVLSDAGAPVAFGTDAGPATRFPGYLEHLELELMVESGLTPEEALLAATGQAASCLDMDGVGVLEPGRWADFLVLAADPLADVAATRTLEAVYVGGGRIQ